MRDIHPTSGPREAERPANDQTERALLRALAASEADVARRARRSHGGDVPQGPEKAGGYAHNGENTVDARPLYTTRGQGRSLTAFTLFSRCQHCAASVSARSS